MSDFPYTDSHIDMLVASLNRAWGSNHFRTGAIALLESLLEDGVTVQFPEPRFRAAKLLDGAAWEVREGGCGWRVALFDGKHPDPEGAAKAEADRMNREGRA